MADALVGVSTTRELYLEQASTPLTTATLTYSLWGPTGTLLVDATAASHTGGGWYAVTVDGGDLAAPGLYREQWLGSAGSTDLRRDAAFSVSYADAPLVTRLELRHTIAQLVGDLTLGQAAGGTATTLTDSERTEPADDWLGAYLYLYGGVGRDQARRVSDYAPGTLTVGKAWATTPDSTTLYELHQRFPVDEYNRAINLAIWQGGKWALVPIVDETVEQDDDTLEYTVPAGFYHLAQVWTGNSADGWTRLEHARGEWQTIPGRRLLRVQSAASGNRFRLVGQMVPEQLGGDASYLTMPAEYVTFKAAAHVLSGRARGPQVDRDAHAQLANFYHAQAEAARPNRGVLPGARRL